MKNEVHEFGIGSDRSVVSDVDLAERDLLDIAAEFRGSVDVSTRAVRSSPAEALCSEADRLQASMVVVGNKRVQGVARVLDQWRAPSQGTRPATCTSCTPTIELSSRQQFATTA